MQSIAKFLPSGRAKSVISTYARISEETVIRGKSDGYLLVNNSYFDNESRPYAQA